MELYLYSPVQYKHPLEVGELRHYTDRITDWKIRGTWFSFLHKAFLYLKTGPREVCLSMAFLNSVRPGFGRKHCRVTHLVTHSAAITTVPYQLPHL
jgi:hypothetical protein